MTQEDILRLIEDLKAKGITGLALDIDETLSHTNHLWFSLTLERFGNPENLTPKEMSQKYLHVEKVPYWKEKEDLRSWHFEAVRSEFLHENSEPIADALETIKKINEEIPIVAYITARFEMLRGATLRWLEKHNFPELPLIMKPDSVTLPGNEWKAGVLHEIYPHIFGIVDDNPGLSTYIADHYEGYVFVFGRAEHEDGRENIIACEDWKKVHEKVMEIRHVLPDANS